MTEQYQKILKTILGKGDVMYEPRTQEYILGISASQSIYDLREGFPLVTTKKVNPRLPFEELFWKLRGERNVKSLVDKKVNIWTANAFDRYLRMNKLEKKFPKHSQEWNEEFANYSQKIKNDSKFAEVAGDLGPVYGYNWRNDTDAKTGKHIDQLVNALNGIKNKPGSRYHALSAWNVSRLSDMALGPCPFWHQFSVWGDNLDLTVSQRSNDIFLGVPFNIAEDALFLEMMAKESGLQARYFTHQTINTHAYLGVPERANFWIDGKNVKEFQKRFSKVKNKEDYLELKKWYINTAPNESMGNEKKDHIPFVLEQLSKEPKNLSNLIFKENVPFMDAISMLPLDIVKIENYNPHKWASKAEMAS